jgi:hypothetical protein
LIVDYGDAGIVAPSNAIIAERNCATARLIAEYAQSFGAEPVIVTDAGE